ncbi:MAG: hypothetical protein IPN33_14700 [Saprospiraceae bacterium]|nr:hypothetical protein [Saprospiraceae bacterium]
MERQLPVGNGAGFNGYCFSLALSTGKRLYAGGIFTQAGNVPANYIASWNGNNWTPLGNGLGDACFAIATNNAEVYAGGFFTTAGGSPAGYIAKWDANGWSALGSGLSGECLSLAFSQGKLYAGGNFLVAGGVPANRIALWNGISWSALGGGLNGPCLALSAVAITTVFTSNEAATGECGPICILSPDKELRLILMPIILPINHH